MYMCIYTNVIHILKYMIQGISSCTHLYAYDSGYKNTNILTRGYARIGHFIFVYVYIYCIVYYHIYTPVQIYYLKNEFISTIGI